MIHSGKGHFTADTETFAKVSVVQKGKRLLAKDVQIQRGIIFSHTRGIFPKGNIQLPMKLALNAPMLSDSIGKLIDIGKGST